MSFRLDVLPAAIADITKATRWYEDQREGLGAEFALAVNETIETLAEQALFFRVRYRRKSARWTFPRRFPFRICYYLEGETVRVFSVIHAARHDRLWKQRLWDPPTQPGKGDTQ